LLLAAPHGTFRADVTARDGDGTLLDVTLELPGQDRPQAGTLNPAISTNWKEYGVHRSAWAPQ